MKSLLITLSTVSTLFLAGTALAGEKTATIEVSGLYCASCPYIASQAVLLVPSTEIVGGFYDAEQQLAQFVVQYDDEVATLADLVSATDEVGYPARLVSEGES